MDEDLALMTHGHNLATFLVQNPVDGPRKARALFGADESLKGGFKKVHRLMDELIALVAELDAKSPEELISALRQLDENADSSANPARQRALMELHRAIEHVERSASLGA